MEGSADHYAVVGHPVAHSLSPFIHSLFARQTEQSLTYRLMDVAPERFAERVREFFAAGGQGVNITLPHKTRAMALADELTERARLAGAVNTLAARRDGSLLGDNTDGAGLVQDLSVNLGWSVRDRSVLLIGAGGAARGVIAPLLALAPRRIVIANRTAERAVALAEVFAGLGALEGCGFTDLAEQRFELIINATSASLTGELPAVPAAAFGADTLCYDMAYGRGDTPFTRWARELGCRDAMPGWGMLVEQAAESFRLWRGVRPLTAPVLAALTGRTAVPGGVAD